MITANEVLAFLETIAPTALKMDWDNVGLLCGRGDKPVRTVMVALDPFTSVCEEAASAGADLLVTHHPLIFHPLTSVTDSSTVGRAIRVLIANDITAVNAHTNLDCAEGGVNDTLAQCLNLERIKKINEDPAGLLRQGIVAEQPLEAFLSSVKAALGCKALRYVSGDRPVKRVAVGGGACGSEMAAVIAAGCDTFITADVKYNQFCDAAELGLNLIDAGHFQTENPVCRVLADKIQTAFPELTVLQSKSHKDPMKFY